jgi:hypothetical protein
MKSNIIFDYTTRIQVIILKLHCHTLLDSKFGTEEASTDSELCWELFGSEFGPKVLPADYNKQIQ